MASNSHSETASLYDVLGIDKSASVDDVRKAYKRKALETHPDKLNPDATEDERTYAETQFRKVNEAFQILSDSRQRQLYDARSKVSSQGNKWTSSGGLERRMQERAEWARRQQEQQRNRVEAMRQRRQEEILRGQEIDRIAQMVNGMVDMLNNEIPGWVERKQKVQQMKAEREARARLASRAH